MADQRSRGGKKEGTNAPPGQSEKQLIRYPESQAGDLPEPGGRPPAGEPAGPRPNAGQTRPQDD